MFKILRTATASILSLALLAGCSGAASTTQESSTKVTDKPVELVVYTAFGISREALDEVIDMYETKYPNVNVKVKETRGGNFLTQDGQMNTALFEDGDVVLLNDTTARSALSADAVRDLSSVRLPSFDPVVAALADELTKADGRRFAIPLSVQPSMFMMNAQAFTAAGVAEPPLDWTIQEFEQVLTQFKNATAETKPNLNLQFILEPLVRTYGGKTFDSTTQEWVFDTPEAQQGLAWVARMVGDGLLSTQGLGSRFEMRIGGGPNAQRPALTSLGNNLNINFPGMLYQPLPKGPKGRSVPASATVGVVMKNAANPEVATDFLKEMASNPTAQLALARAGVRPLTSDAKALAAWRETVGDRNADAIELSLNGAYVETNTRIREFLSGITPYLEGKSTLEQTIPALMQQLSQ